MIVEKIEAWLCEMPLPHLIDLGKFTVHQRSYLALRVHASGGLFADCVTQSRGSPLDVIVTDVLAPRIIGKDAREITALRSDVDRDLTALELHGAICRAWSALEVCLQDLRAQACDWPLWRLLGGSPGSVPVQVVEGYAIRGEPESQFVDRLVARADQGFQIIKVEAGHFQDDATLIRQLEQFRGRVGRDTQLVLDMAWSWTESKSHRSLLRALEPLGIGWIEDPFRSHAVQSYQELRSTTCIPVGGGDETSRAENMFALLEGSALDVIRLDASTMGGIDAVRSLSSEALRRGVRVAYHVHPEIHEHLVFGLGIADHVEMFPTDRHFDLIHDFTQRPSFDRVKDGHLSSTDEPGTGMRLNLGKLASLARRYSYRD